MEKGVTRTLKGCNRDTSEKQTMSQSLSRILIHATFSTKLRDRSLAYPDLREHLDAYTIGILRNLECPALQVGSVIDHMHLFFLQARTAAVAEVVGIVKKETSAWIKTQNPEINDPFLAKFAWQSGYAAFSVSESGAEAVMQYIRNQEEHHRRITFQDEYRAFLTKHGVAFDEKYVWD
jgi:REP element-mobilizing transposase RayT